MASAGICSNQSCGANEACNRIENVCNLAEMKTMIFNTSMGVARLRGVSNSEGACGIRNGAAQKQHLIIRG